MSLLAGCDPAHGQGRLHEVGGADRLQRAEVLHHGLRGGMLGAVHPGGDGHGALEACRGAGWVPQVQQDQAFGRKTVISPP
jgi:hypothetical protein